MDIEKALLRPKHLLKEDTERIAKAAAGAEKSFQDLLQLLCSENLTLSKRAAWCFSLAAGLRPDWTDQYQPALVELLSVKNPHDALLRNVLRVLRDCRLQEAVLDKLAYYCFEFVQDPKQAIAIRAFALHILGQIGCSVPEIRPEVKAIIAYYFEQGAPGLVSAGKAVLKRWEKANKAALPKK